ncbi:transporter substrate-binding domain-containing protein [Siminovitchia fortis]|uniref:Transporter substrate-binding domain-containing protein n=1 Tax=Siminovitchia fortis TaxID=254758 RepID=A0A443IRM3_9BACI|nr:transporter substrate-binding domain-containing protein [Siminovitchia fortis]RWR08979.1 transporter substrate-binding domain-containing protein [Siminovitchia fortis]WHY81413.1 transporter substrate-binding domain-containing protein [Siminovitchia fortis]
MKKISFFLGLLMLVLLLGACSPNTETETAGKANNTETEKQATQLNKILDEGVLRVGTTGDYKPFTYLNPETKEYEGYDIDAAKKLAEDLGVKVEFVETTWPALMDDLIADKFDIGMGGITRTLERQKTANLSNPYLDFGKGAIIRAEDQKKYTSIDDLNQPHVKVGVNPGGTNEEFVQTHLKKAEVTVVENNLDIPKKVAEGEFDVMITDNIEAIIYAKEDKRLFSAFEKNTLTHSQMGYLMRQGEDDFHNFVNLWIDEMKLNGEFDKLHKKWIE